MAIKVINGRRFNVPDPVDPAKKADTAIKEAKKAGAFDVTKTTTPDAPELEVEKTSAEKAADIQERLFDERTISTSLADRIQKIKTSLEEETQRFGVRRDLAEKIETRGIERAVSQGQAAVAGTTAALAQGREGVVSATSPEVARQFAGEVGTRINTQKLRLDQSRLQREDIERRLIEAQRGRREGLAIELQERLDLASAAVNASELALREAEAQGTERAFKLLDQLPAGSFAGLDIEVLMSLGLNPTTATALQAIDVKRQELQADDPNFQLKQAQLKKAQSEAKSAGLTNDQKNFLFASELTGRNREQFLNFAGKNPTFGFTKVGDTLYATNPKTGAVKLVVGKDTNIQPTGNFATATVGSREITLDSGALVTFQQAYNQLTESLGENPPFQSKETFSKRNLDLQKQIYGKGRSEEELVATGDFSLEEAAKFANVNASQVSWTLQSKHLDGLAVDYNFEGKDIDYINDVERVMNNNGWSRPIPGEDPGHFVFNGKQAGTQLDAQIRAFVQSRSGVKDKDARIQLEKDISNEISSGRATTPSEAKLNLGIVSSEDKEVKTRIKADLSPIRKDTNEILRNVKNIEQLALLEGGIGDTAAITAFLKTIDPGSVARESEVAGVENARGLLDGVNVFFAKLETGDRLSTGQRKQLQETAIVLGNLARENMFEKLITGKQELLDRGVDPTVISDFEINRLQRDLGLQRASQIRVENGLEALEGAQQGGVAKRFGFTQLDNSTLIDE